MSWFIFSILAALFWGFENFLYKVSAQKGYNTTKIITVFGITITVLSFLLFVISGEKITNINLLLLLAFLNAVLFFSSVITRFEALKKIGISLYYPINRTGTFFLMRSLSLIFY